MITILENITFYIILLFSPHSVVRKFHTEHTLYQLSIDTKALAVTSPILKIIEDMGIISGHKRRFI